MFRVLLARKKSNPIIWFMAVRGSFLLTVAALFACASGREAILRQQATDDLRCQSEALQLDAMAPYFQKVSGCGRENVYYFVPQKDEWVSPIKRAMFDLSCAQDKLQVLHLEGRQVAVSGCGQKAVYVLGKAGWLMNTASTAAAPRPSRDG